MPSDTCNLKCDGCPLLEVCGGIEGPNFSCPFFDCPKARTDGLVYMKGCSVCRLPDISWKLSRRQILDLMREVQVLEQMNIMRVNLPKLVPMIDPSDKALYAWNQTKVEAIIIEFHQLLNDEILEAVKARGIHETLGYDGTVILSSIMPDHLLVKSEILEKFIEAATKGGFDAVLGWDTPVYEDIPLYDSWTNLLMGIKLTRQLLGTGIPVIPLAKGNNQRQIAFSIDNLVRMGFRDIALHASEYLYSWKRDPKSRQILYQYSGELMRKAETVLLLGATSPQALGFARNAFPDWHRMRMAGFSWYLDAVNHRLYARDSPNEILDSRGSFVECGCETCRSNGARRLAEDVSVRAAHNLGYSASKATGKQLPKTMAYDLVIGKDVKALIAGDLHIGTEGSLYTDFLDLLKAERPNALILLGNTFELDRGSIIQEDVKNFFETIRDIGATLVTVKGCRDSSQEDILKHVDRLAFAKGHKALAYRQPEGPDEKYALDFYKLHRMAKEALAIKLPNGKMMLASHGQDIVEERTVSLEEAKVVMLRHRRAKRADWLVIGHIHRAFVDGEKGIASPGSWQLPTPDLKGLVKKGDVMRAIIIGPSGEISLI